MCGCPHHKAVPGLIVLIGLLFLLNAFGAISQTVVMAGWPILLIFIGLSKMFGHKCGCCKM